MDMICTFDHDGTITELMVNKLRIDDYCLISCGSIIDG